MTNVDNQQKVFIFDFDGTIADTFPFTMEIVRMMAKEIGREDEVGQLLSEFKQYGSRHLLKKYKMPVFKFLRYIKRAQKILSENTHEIKIFPGIESILKELAKEGTRLCILSSNNKRNITEVLKVNEVLHFFEFIHAGSSPFGKAKRLSRLVRKYHFDQENTYYFGDELADISAAETAGVHSVAVTWGFNSKESFSPLNPDYTLDKVEEILSL